jgi:hypothetical protein
MTAKTRAALPTANGTEATCPECRMNQIESPFDYCSMCEMLACYFREKLATPDQLHDQQKFSEAYDKWRSILTWAQIVDMRDRYWTRAKRAKVKAQAAH